MSAAAAPWTTYSFAVLRVVPHPHLGTAYPVGVLLHARTADYLDLRVLSTPAALAPCAHGADVELLSRYLQGIRAICAGDAELGGAVALLPASERFHWLTAPRSDVIQCGPVHGGLCEDPVATLDDLFALHVPPENRVG